MKSRFFISISLIIITFFNSSRSDNYSAGNANEIGLYASTPRTDAERASWNELYPGDKIPIGKYNLGTLDAGIHKLEIDFPEILFTDSQGNMPLSVYIRETGNKTH